MTEASIPPAQKPGPYKLGVGSSHLLLAYGQEQGLDSSLCLRNTGYLQDLLDDPLAEIPPEQELQLISNLVEHLGSPFLHGFTVGQRYGISSYGIFGLGIMSSSCGSDAAQFGMRFEGTPFHFIRYRLLAKSASLMLEMDHDHLTPGRREFLIARDLGSILAIHNDLLPDLPIGITGIALKIERCLGMENVEKLFRCQVLTQRPNSQLVLDPAVLQATFPHANAITMRQCETYWDGILQRRRIDPTMTTRVHQHLMAGKTPLPTAGEVARNLGLSERGLRRKLKHEGSQWRRLLDEVMQIRAEEGLRSGKFRIREVAEQLGYAEPSSFSHAFKRWTGKSPAQFCRENRRTGVPSTRVVQPKLK